MVHTVCTNNESEQLTHIQRLAETLFASDMELEDKLRRLIATEADEFDLEHGFLSRIDTDAETEQFEIVHGARGDLAPNKTVQLSTTYCRKTIADPTGTMAVSDASAEGWEGDPAYERFNLGSYLGTTVSVGDNLYGTLCYANTEPRSEPIAEEEVRLIEIEGQWLGFLLSQGTTPVDHGGDSGFEMLPSSSAQLDSVMNALMRSERRVVLSMLLNTPTDTSIESIARKVPRENARELLHHVHLPKLAEEEYIEWDPDAKTVSRGPNFVYVEPLLRLIAYHTDTGSA